MFAHSRGDPVALQGLALVIGLASCLVAHATATTKSAPVTIELFSRPPLDPRLPAPDYEPDYFTARAEYPVEVDWRSLGAAAAAGPDVALRIALPNRAPVVVRQRAFSPKTGFGFREDGSVWLPADRDDREVGFHWYGVADRTEVSVTVTGGFLIARIAPDQGLWTVVDGANTVLRDIDPSRYPIANEGLPEESGAIARASRPLTDVRSPKTIDFIDVLFVYTEKALTKAGSVSAINAYIESSISNLNLALANSGVVSVAFRNAMPNATLDPADPTATAKRISFASPTDFTNTELNGLYPLSPSSATSQQEHFRYHKRWAREQPQIRAWRDVLQADVVVLLVSYDLDVDSDEEIDVCGNGYIQLPNCDASTYPAPHVCGVGAAYEPFAYAAVSVMCMVERHEVAHELGHALGMEHQAGTLSSAVWLASYPWSYAYRRTNYFDPGTPGHRTIMAYRCPAPQTKKGDYCPVKLHFSNPLVDFQDAPGYRTGLPAPQPHDGQWTFNARTAALLAPYVSEFRGGTTTRIFRGDFEALPDVRP